MSNGPYRRHGCRCGAVACLVCGDALALAVDDEGRPVSLWPAEAVQLAQGVDALRESQAGQGRRQACRHCGEVVLVEHESASVVALPEPREAEAPSVAVLAAVQRRRLAALGYRLDGAGGG
jgi:hypothetical protein